MKSFLPGGGKRHYLTAKGVPYTELMCFMNYDGGVDVYMHVSTWQVDTWALYTIDDESDPVNWHKATTMTFVRNEVWTIEELYMKGDKRKYDDVADSSVAMMADNAGAMTDAS